MTHPTALPAAPSQPHTLAQEPCTSAQLMPPSTAEAAVPVPCTALPPSPPTPTFAVSKGRIVEDDDAIYGPLAVGAAALVRQPAASTRPLPQVPPPSPSPAAGPPYAFTTTSIAPGTPSPPSSFTIPAPGPATPAQGMYEQQGAYQGFTADSVRQRSVAPFEVAPPNQARMLQPMPTFGQIYKKELARTLAKAANADPKKTKKLGKTMGKAIAPMAASPCGPCLLPLAFLGLALYFPIKAAVKAFKAAKLQEKRLLEQEVWRQQQVQLDARQQQVQLDARQFAMAAQTAEPLQAQMRAVPAGPQQLPLPGVVPMQAVQQPLQQPQQPQLLPATPRCIVPEPFMPAVPQHPLPQCLPVGPQHLQPVCVLAA